MKKLRKLTCIAIVLSSLAALLPTSFAEVNVRENTDNETGFSVKLCVDTGMTYPEMNPTFEPIGLGGLLTVSAIDAFERQFNYDAEVEGSYLTIIPSRIRECATFQNETETQNQVRCSCIDSHSGTAGFDGPHTSTYGLHLLMNYDDTLSLGEKWGACFYYASHPICIAANTDQTVCTDARGSAKSTITNGLVRGTCVVRKRPFSKMDEAMKTTTHELGHVFGASHHTDATICVMNTQMQNRPDITNENAFCTTCATIILSYMNSCRTIYAATSNQSTLLLRPIIQPDGTIVYTSDEIADPILPEGKSYEEFGLSYADGTLVRQEVICDPVEKESWFEGRENVITSASAKEEIYEWIGWKDTKRQVFSQSETSGAWEYQLETGATVTLQWYNFGKEYTKRMEESCKTAADKGNVVIEQGEKYPVYYQRQKMMPDEWNYWIYHWVQDETWFTMQSVGVERLPAEVCRVERIFSNDKTNK